MQPGRKLNRQAQERQKEGCSKDLCEGCTISFDEEPKLSKVSINTLLLGRQRQSGSPEATIVITIPVDQEKRKRPSPLSDLLLLSTNLNSVRPGLQALINDNLHKAYFLPQCFDARPSIYHLPCSDLHNTHLF
uniref:Uncharacterized protein n=1 Tax=Myotis myotis TaxID=51298 RepID=A0A7J7V3J4_MYOMY|nr:hypothetical protein mMyoMyo1_008474 [Myotis myotis]